MDPLKNVEYQKYYAQRGAFFEKRSAKLKEDGSMTLLKMAVYEQRIHNIYSHSVISGLEQSSS